ncbi:MAG: inorganic diphosphatase [Pirellulales bacterium]|nr:inorganic diphosphatase [Pirellulales bacterium]
MITVFVQNEAGRDLKHAYNEKTLEYLGVQTVSRPYPFPYGFILNTTSEDGDNLDCFVITERKLTRGSTITCEPAALLEQIEDGLADHNVLAVLPDEPAEIGPGVVDRLRSFIRHVFDHVPGKQIGVGRLLDRQHALDFIAAHADASTVDTV